MRFSSLVLKNLFRRPTRSALTLIALATAIAAVVALIGIARGFTDSFKEIYAAHSVDIVVSRQGSADRLSSSVDAGYSESIANLDSVDRAEGVLLETLSLEDDGVYGIPTMGVPPGSWILEDYELEDQIDSSSRARAVKKTSEVGLDLQDNIERSLMLGVHLADRIGVRAGGTVSLFDESYLVTSIFRSRSTWENGSMILPLATLQAVTDRTDQVTYINVVLSSRLAGNAAQKAIQDIEAIDAKLLPLATSEFVETDTRMQLAGAMAWMTSLIALVIGTIGTLNTMLTSVLERTREIGILRAIGWPRKRVVLMILLESCSLAIVASIVGSLLAIALTWGLSQAPAAKGILNPAIGWQVVLQGFALAIGIGLLGAILPAWRATQLQPTEAFREH